MIYLCSIVIDIIFGIWGALGQPWYWYPLNIVLLFCASSMINTSYIQWLTRTYSVFALKAPRAFSQVAGLTVLTLVLWALSYIIGRITLSSNFQIALFFLACILVSTIVALVDGMFQVAINKTEALIQMHQGPDHNSEDK